MYKPHLIAAYMSYPLLVWFIVASIVIFLSREDKPWCLLVLVFYWGFYSFVIYNKLFDQFGYIENKEKLIYFDGAVAASMTFLLYIDKVAWKHALILGFATLCHVMIILDLSIHSSFFSNFFYVWYDELIIMVGLLQIMVSFNGFISAYTKALCFIQALLRRRSPDSYSYSKSIRLQGKGKA